MKINTAELSNFDSIFSLNQQLTLPIKPYPWNKKYWIKQQIRNGSFYIVEERVVYSAMCLHHELEDSPEEAYIETISVRRDKQRKGVGRSLVEFAIQQARQTGKTKLTVESFCEFNVKDFYLKCGFQLEPEIGIYQEKYPFYCFIINL